MTTPRRGRAGNRRRQRPITQEWLDYEMDRNQEWEVDNVLSERRTPRGLEYLLHWTGMTPEEATWEPHQNLSCDNLLRNFRRLRRLQVRENLQMAFEAADKAEAKKPCRIAVAALGISVVILVLLGYGFL